MATPTRVSEPVNEDEDPFAVELEIVTEVGAEMLPQACGTSDGCAPTCASSCVSGT